MEPYPEFDFEKSDSIPYFPEVHAFFNLNAPDIWTPTLFATDPTTTNFDAFISGLNSIRNNGRMPVNVFAAKCHRWVMNEENEVALEEARSLLSAKVAKKQAYIASILAKERFDSGLTRSFDQQSSQSTQKRSLPMQAGRIPKRTSTTSASVSTTRTNVSAPKPRVAASNCVLESRTSKRSAAEVISEGGEADEGASSSSSSSPGRRQKKVAFSEVDFPLDSESDYAPSSARSSLNSIDFRYIDHLVGPGTTSSRLTTMARLIIDQIDISELLMDARRLIIKKQSEISDVSDLL
ncbi:hypothetical protein BGX27_000870 [Mortierella sp. AM989]|nr:hypothetical protein BGX27_000870 [Mortierella sp. AM989]